MTTTPHCPFCANQTTPLYCAGEHRMFRCTSCALAFVSPVPSEEYLARYYAVFHQTIGEGGEYELIDSRMQADFPAKLALIGRHAALAGARLLDVGCGKGFFVRACRDSGIDAMGIDLSDSGIEYATGQLGVPARLGRIEDCADDLGQFDIATFWATIEHVPDPVSTLRAIHSVLAPGGRLFMDTGIGDDWLDRMLPGVNQWYDPPQHLYVFSVDAMRLALSRAGFEIERIDTNFERSLPRRVAKSLRGAAAAIGFRAVAELTRTKQMGSNGFGLTRFPLGNLMSVVARKKQD